MKSTYASFVSFAVFAFTAFTFAAQAAPETGDNVLAANIVRFSLLDSSEPQHTAIQGGQVLVNLTQRTIMTVINRQFACTGATCEMDLAMPQVVELPIVDSHKDNCGRKTLVAEGAINGGIGHIELVDNSKYSCPQLIHLQPTVVQVTQQSASQAPSQETIYASSLQQLK